MGAAEQQAQVPIVLTLKPQVISYDAFTVIMEYLSSTKQFLRLRQCCKVFDRAVFRMCLIKLTQARSLHSYLQKEVNAYEHDLSVENLQMHLQTLQNRLQKIYKKLNVCQSVCEFYSFGEPPDYIFYIGEALGEAVSMIPLRTGEPAL